jgi:hypothetical protein
MELGKFLYQTQAAEFYNSAAFIFAIARRFFELYWPMPAHAG